MAHTVTLIADHKGFTRPRVSGDEYFVDAHINITAYVAGGVTVTASSLGLATINSAMVTGQEALDVGSSVTLNLYPEGADSGDAYYTGTALVTGASVAVTMDGVISRTFNVQFSGGVTHTTV